MMSLPLCVDLDGTLIREDVTFFLLRALFKKGWGKFFLILGALLLGRAYFKKKLSEVMAAEITHLEIPDSFYTPDFLEFLLQQKEQGRVLILATAADLRIAQRVVYCLEKKLSLRVFESILASDGSCNLRAHRKADALVCRFGERQFSYAGNSKDDFAVWGKAGEVIVVNPSMCVLKKTRTLYPKALYFGV